MRTGMATRTACKAATLGSSGSIPLASTKFYMSIRYRRDVLKNI